MRVRDEVRTTGGDRRVKRLLRLGRRITRLLSELETLNFMQDRLERELESRSRSVGGRATAGRPDPKPRRG